MEVECTEEKKELEDKDITMWWFLGVQMGRYVALPPVWVHDNIAQDVIDEALWRGKARLTKEHDGPIEQFVRLPPGDCQTDNPPLRLQNQHIGLNYYYPEW